MRVTSTMFPDALVYQLQLLAARQQKLQKQVATGQRIQYPSDDPSAARRVLDLQAENARVTQYQDNIARLQEQVTATGSVMLALKKISDRASEIATLADGTSSPQELQIYAAEITQLIQQAADLSNTQFQSNYLLAGTKTDTPPFVVTTDSSGNVTGVTYQGNTTVRQAEVAEGVTLSTQTVGANTGGSGPTGLLADSRAGADFFAHLIALQDHLVAGDTDAISTGDIPALGLDEQNLITGIAQNGAIGAQLEAAKSILGNRAASLEQLTSNAADADVAQTIVQLGQTQTAYQAALQSGANVLQLSLLDYLR